MKKISVAVLVSGGGTNLQAIIDAASAGIIRSAELRVVISDREGAYALTRAQNAGIEAVALPKKRFRTHEEFEKELERQLDLRRIELIVLAGFTSILGKDFAAQTVSACAAVSGSAARKSSPPATAPATLPASPAISAVKSDFV